MPIVGSSNTMGTPFFHEFKKQASFYLKEKIRTARLALTDVTPAQLLTEEAINGTLTTPDAKTMRCISRAAFEVDEYWRIVGILHKSFAKFDRQHWREAYRALVVLEHLLTQGPESTAEEFQSDREVIEEMSSILYIDEKGFNWGLTVRKKTERVLKLLEKGPLLKEERDRARKISRGIQGFGSFNVSWSSTKNGEEDSHLYGRSNSHYEDYRKQDDDVVSESEKENLKSESVHDAEVRETAVSESRSLKESSIFNRLAINESASVVTAKPHPLEESKALLSGEEGRKVEDHPFSNFEPPGRESLLLSSRT